MIRNPDQKPTIVAAGKQGPGEVEVLVASLEDVKSDADAKKILDDVKPDWVVWSAGAGGKGGPSRTYAIDRDACIHFIRSSVATPSISKFLLVSAFNERRNRAPWWDNDEEYAKLQKMNEEVLPDYYKAKLAADEALTVLGEERIKNGTGGRFQYIILRPGGLTDEAEKGKVALGKTKSWGTVTRGDVADVAARLLEKEGAHGWVDLLNGDEPVADAVDRVVREKINTVEGEDLGVMRAHLST